MRNVVAAFTQVTLKRRPWREMGENAHWRTFPETSACGWHLGYRFSGIRLERTHWEQSGTSAIALPPVSWLWRTGPSPADLGLGFLDDRDQRLKRIEQQRVRIEGPTVDDAHGSKINQSVNVVVQVDLNMLGQCCHALGQASPRRDRVVRVVQHIFRQEPQLPG